MALAGHVSRMSEHSSVFLNEHRNARVEEKYGGGWRIQGKPPTYPLLAKTQKIEGLVIPEVISGRKELRASALETVKTSKYEPIG